ncbi:hypothetical protein A5789_28375 [Nocardia sp. 852002-51101_SCH5132738]|nr:hypothetical protein A5789_28375 [Nocardia sp. 852002-51101_SCH5132738]OBF82725.1 hypothetical protein A9X06_19015 [Mycobacterium sp. 852002-51759_SCH5129042]
MQIRDFLREHGLVLAASEEFADRRMLFRRAVFDVYVRPEERDQGLSTWTPEAEEAEDYNRENLLEACAICDHWHDKEAPHLVTDHKDCTDCLTLHR